MYANGRAELPLLLGLSEAWLGHISYRREAGPYSAGWATPFATPTAATRLPSGRILVLERGFVLIGLEVSARLVRLEAADLRAGARLAGEEVAVIRQPLTVDNMEGLTARADGDEKTLIYLISDDNFSPLQRTLLMMFELVE